MKYLLFILIFSFSHLYAEENHPLHVSMVNIEYNKSDSSFTLSAKIFTDDFEEILLQKYGIRMNLGKEDENKDSGKYFSQYVNEKFSIIFDGKTPENLLYIKKEQNFEAIWLYFTIKPPINFKSVEISNEIMFDMFHDQKNLIIFNYSGIQKAYMFNLKKSNEVFEV